MNRIEIDTQINVLGNSVTFFVEDLIAPSIKHNIPSLHKNQVTKSSSWIWRNTNSVTEYFFFRPSEGRDQPFVISPHVSYEPLIRDPWQHDCSTKVKPNQLDHRLVAACSIRHRQHLLHVNKWKKLKVKVQSQIIFSIIVSVILGCSHTPV